MNDSSLSARDARVIWHPYTQHRTWAPPIPILRGEGALLYDDAGRSYIDAISSWWVNIHGHAHPHIAAAVAAQASRLAQVIFTGFTHEPAVSLAERLLPLLPGDMARMFYSDNGSTAVEVALKMAIQYARNRGKKKNTILALEHAYHGDTFGAMSVSGRGLFTDAFGDHLFNVCFLPVPSAGNFEAMIAAAEPHLSDAAAFIYEPLLQAAGGMIVYESAALDRWLAYLRSRGILCIADEVMTGFGRTGTLFAGERCDAKPDIICLSKGITGGTMALGATACTSAIFDAFDSDDFTHTFFHGHSFTANPIACAAALASLDLSLAPDCRKALARIEAAHRAFAAKQAGSPRYRNLRVLGTLLAFEIPAEREGYASAIGRTLTINALGEGIYIRPLGNTVYLLPPYCTTDDQLNRLYGFLEKEVG